MRYCTTFTPAADATVDPPETTPYTAAFDSDNCLSLVLNEAGLWNITAVDGVTPRLTSFTAWANGAHSLQSTILDLLAPLLWLVLTMFFLVRSAWMPAIITTMALVAEYLPGTGITRIWVYLMVLLSVWLHAMAIGRPLPKHEQDV